MANYYYCRCIQNVKINFHFILIKAWPILHTHTHTHYRSIILLFYNLSFIELWSRVCCMCAALCCAFVSWYGIECEQKEIQYWLMSSGFFLLLQSFHTFQYSIRIIGFFFILSTFFFPYDLASLSRTAICAKCQIHTHTQFEN